MIHFKTSGQTSGKTSDKTQAPEVSWIILVHGLTCAHGDWCEIEPVLSSRHAVLTVDLRGHGKSADLPGPYDIETLAADVLAVMHHLGIKKATIAGHSMGTRVIAAAARAEPGLFDGLFFIDGSRQAHGNAHETETLSLPANPGISEFIENMFAKMFTEDSNVIVKKEIIDRATSTPPEIFRKLLCGMLDWDARQFESCLAQLKMPVTILQSTNVDRQRQRVTLKTGDSTPYLEEIKKLIPHAEIEIVPNTGHFTQIDAASLVADRLDMLSRGWNSN